MSERWFGRRSLPVDPKPPPDDPPEAGREHGGVGHRSPFEPPSERPEIAAPAETEDSGPLPSLALRARLYAALTLRARSCTSCVFVPAQGEPFSRSYVYLQGINWLKGSGEQRREGFVVLYSASSVEVRGRGLWPLFLSLSEHRAYALHQFDPELWELPASGPIITHIAPKSTTPASKGKAGPEDEGS